ncbi:AraC family transcriptional regulator [Marilutibacter aestuarii]|uniref:AraC family transcriptional regulator n=1 Tax=Marilutibacter aestuarii TaxID=1706195 RepID=A0A508AUZ3_9GAMM|nr:AraC family transcriptional regulator [Lysobacter aestuarii]TQD51458.1 AraC family transcriptional regulator [Lysobacter aestuarii]
MDPLSEVLKSIRLDGAVYINAEFTAPWCAMASYGMPVAAVRAMGADHVVFFHCVTDGHCLTCLDGGGGEAELHAGDVVVFPHNHRHRVGSDVGLPAVDADTLMPPTRSDDIIQLRHGGGGEAVHFVCGYLACNRRVSRALLAGLPEVIKVSLLDRGDGAWLLDLLRMGVRESSAGSAGAQTILTKLSELLIAEALRRHAEALPPDATGWLAGLRDPVVGKALALMHARPAQAWNVESLARATASSRSALGQRFGNLLGEPPMRYLASHRLALAAQALRNSRATVAEVAEQVGYGAEAAFTRAFKREFGTPPGQWRQGQAVETVAA